MNRLHVFMMSLAVCAACALPATACAERAATGDARPLIPYERFVLPNGLRVLVHTDRSAPLISVSVWYHVGSKDEGAGLEGFAHLYEHLMFNGSEHADTEFMVPLQRAGATGINGTTTLDRTNYFETVPKTALESVLWLESDRMGHLLGAVTQEKLDNQRSVVLNEKRRAELVPYGQTERLLHEGLFPPGHPYRWTTVGSEKDLNSATLENVKDWFRRHYGAANAVLVLAGDIDATEARPLVEKYFGALQSGPPRTRVSRWVPRRSDPVRVVSHDRVAAPRITRAWTAPAFGDEEVPDMDLLARILGGGRSSRLYRELVADAQLATEVDVQNVTYEIAGVFMISITLAPNADVARAEAVLDRALAKFLREGPSRAELERARAEIAADFAIANESPATRGFVLAECELYTGTPGCIDHYFGRLRSANPQRVRVRAADWLGEGYFQLEIHPFGTPQGLSDTVDRSRMPLPEQFPEAIPPHIETGRLSNGIEVTVVERRSSPLVRMAVVVVGGVAGGQAFSPGLAQLAWEMLGEEGEGAFAQIGARLHSRLARDWGILSFEVPADHFARAAELTAQSLIRPAFAADDLQRVRVLNRARLEQSISNPRELAGLLFAGLVFGEEHPYAANLGGLGSATDLSAIARADLLDYHERAIRPERTRIYVVGDASFSSTMKLLESRFGGWRARGEASVLPISSEHTTSGEPSRARIVIVDQPGATQSMIIAGSAVPQTLQSSEEELQVFNALVGGDFLGRLNLNLREDKGWSYGMHSAFMFSRLGATFATGGLVETDRTADAMAEMRREIADLLGNRPPTDEEVSGVIHNRIVTLPGRYQTGDSVLHYLVTLRETGRSYDELERVRERLTRLDAQAVSALGRLALDSEQLQWLVIGDRSRIEEPVRKLGWAEVEIRSRRGERLH